MARNKGNLLNLEADIKETILRMVGDPNNLEEGKILRQLELERNLILRGIEEQWRLRSRATWLESGDNNTKFFHNYASHSRNQKHIWEIIGGNGVKINDQDLLKQEAVHYFQNFYKAPTVQNTTDQCKIIDMFPQMLSVEESDVLYNPVTLEELKVVLFLFKKDKSPGPDGWTD
jgi:hypothetical protein